MVYYVRKNCFFLLILKLGVKGLLFVVAFFIMFIVSAFGVASSETKLT